MSKCFLDKFTLNMFHAQDTEFLSVTDLNRDEE